MNPYVITLAQNIREPMLYIFHVSSDECAPRVVRGVAVRKLNMFDDLRLDSTFNVRRIRIARLRIRLFVYRSLLCHHVARNTVFQMISLIDSGKRRRLEQEICVTYITSVRSILSFILLPSNTPSSSAECASKTLHVSL